MNRIYRTTLLLFFLLIAGGYVLLRSFNGRQDVDFSTQVKPILNKKCIACHGGVKKNGGISFLFREEMITAGESGNMAVVPGKPGQSEVIRRITHPDPELRMPPEGEALSPDEIDLLTKWIQQGAKWGEHWAYQPLSEPDLPPHPVAKGSTVSGESQWEKNEIDRFILSKLTAEGLSPNEEADCTTLIRRLSLDLTGLPPSTDLVKQFCADPTDARYAQLADSLMSLPAFGEHWAAHWLDLARYADTKGFERDADREIWQYRDWLIRAFNGDLPYDRFTIEQLAGDLLPDPAPDQFIATAFHRNTMSNDEGGTDNEEYRVQAVLDRVNTTWAVWLGTTMNCVQCHSHPYDPIRQEDFYASYAFFNNSRDEDTHHDSPRYRLYEGADSVRLDSIRSFVQGLPFGDQTARDKAVFELVQLIRTSEPKIHPHYFEFLENSAHGDTKTLVFYPGGLVKLPAFTIGKDSLLLISFGGVPESGTLEVRRGSGTGPVAAKIPLQAGYRGKNIFFPIGPSAEAADLYFSYQPAPGSNSNLNINWMLFLEPPFAGFEHVREAVTELLNARNVPSVPVMMENRGKYLRTTHLFERGNWLTHGAPVEPGIAKVFTLGEAQPFNNRLDLAKWIVSPGNPLAARVAVNRFWEQIFGRGIVETSEDFGSQGSLPTHPELLDYLAYHFIHTQKWSIKALLKQIVQSAAYRQSSVVTPLKLERDPYNYWLSRGARVRLSAEQVRDQALAVSGLLSKKMYGLPVMPPQPDGIWSVVYNGSQWKPSEGEDRYRRALYTFWRRTSPYPSMVSFDAPSREFCVIRRIRTNTPLQALVTLNDPVYLEAAQTMAREEAAASQTEKERIERIFQRAVFRLPRAKEWQELESIYQEALAEYRKNPAAAKEMLTPQDQLLFSSVELQKENITCLEEDCAPLAALTLVSNVILNLDAFVTKE